MHKYNRYLLLYYITHVIFTVTCTYRRTHTHVHTAAFDFCFRCFIFYFLLLTIAPIFIFCFFFSVTIHLAPTVNVKRGRVAAASSQWVLLLWARARVVHRESRVLRASLVGNAPGQEATIPFSSNCPSRSTDDASDERLLPDHLEDHGPSVVHQCCRRHERCLVFNVAPNQMDRDNVTAMETDKIVDDDIGNPQVSTYIWTLVEPPHLLLTDYSHRSFRSPFHPYILVH